MKPPLSYVPALPAALGMMAGIIVFYTCDSVLIPVVLIAFAVSAVFFRRYWALFLFIFSAIGWLAALAARTGLPPDYVWHDKGDWGGLVDEVRTNPSSVRLYVNISSLDEKPIQSFKCAVLIPNPPVEFLPGDAVMFKARLHNPDRATDLPNETGFNPTFFVDGISAQAYVSPDDIVLISSSPTLRRTAVECRDKIRDLIYRSPVSASSAWFLSATLLGDDSMLDPAVKQEFRAIGVAHYLALSGFHIGIIAMLASLALFPLRIWSHVGRLRHLAVIILVWIYAFICGLAPSLVRAAVLITIFLLAKILQRQSSPYNSLCVAAIVILTFAPRQLFAPGFQLSFCAVLSILVFAPRFNPFNRRRKRLYDLAALLTIPLAAMIGTCIITVVHFHRFPLLFLLPNIVFAILLPILLSVGVVTLLATALGIRFTIGGRVIDILYNAVSEFSNTFAHIHGNEISGIFLTWPVILFATITIILLTCAVLTKRRLFYFLSILTLFISILIGMLVPPLPRSELYVTRQPMRTDVIVRHADCCKLITTAPESEHQEIKQTLSNRYAMYLSRRGCDSISVVTGDFRMPSVYRQGNYLVFNDKIICLALSPEITFLPDLKIDYMIVSRAAGSNPFTMIKALKPDTVIITRDMPSIRASRLIDSCRTHLIPTVHLTDATFNLKCDI